MPPATASKVHSEQAPRLLATLCTLGALGIAYVVASYGSLDAFEPFGLAAVNRTLNQLTAILLTCVALVVPLTSNLYTPKLVNLYVTHPLIVVGLSVLLLSHLLVIGASYFPPQQATSQGLVIVVSVIVLLVLTAALPYLYGISRFLRPSYFLPMLTRKGIQALQRLQGGRVDEAASKDLFSTIDVVTNIALTGMSRGDRQLALLALQSLHALLEATIEDGRQMGRSWRSAQPYFVPGLAREGQDYLARERIWPEAYLLAQMLKVTEVASKRQHEILGELASHLVGTAAQAFGHRQEAIVELHVMAFNTLMRQAIDERDLRHFQNVSYHYRVLIEGFASEPERMNSSTRHLIHYGRMAGRQGPDFGLETVLYDVGELVLSVGRRSEDAALGLAGQLAGGLLMEHADQPGPRARVAWRALVRLYWEARAANLTRLAEYLSRECLKDAAPHREQIGKALSDNRELHFEFNDRLMRFAYLSPAAEALARGFLESDPYADQAPG